MCLGGGWAVHTSPKFSYSFAPRLAPQGLLKRDKGQLPETLDTLLKSRNIPDASHDAFKTGFAEGFLKAQALTQRTQGQTHQFSFPVLNLYS